VDSFFSILLTSISLESLHSHSKLTKVLEKNQGAIFDLMWLPSLFSNQLCFLVAPATPHVELWSYDKESGIKNTSGLKIGVNKIWSCELTEGSKALYLDAIFVGYSN
jgi:hypothetical protein